MKSLAHLKWQQIVFWLIVCGMVVHALLKGADFHVFYVAGERIWRGESLYQFKDSWMPFKYHPLWGIFFSLSALLPEKLALLFFSAWQLSCWYWLAWYWAKKLNYDLTSWSNRLILLIIALSSLSAELGLGQINGLMFVGLTLFFDWLESDVKRPILAGGLLILLASLKLNLLLLGCYAVLRSWRTLIGMAVACIGLHLVVAGYQGAVFSTVAYVEWLNLLFGQSSQQYHTIEAQGFLRLFLVLVPNHAKELWAVTVGVFVFGGVALERAKIQDSSIVRPLYWITGNYLLSPLAWWYQILFVFPLAFYLLKKTQNPLRKAILGCLFVFAVFNYNTLGPKGMNLFKEYQGYFTCSLFMFAALVLQICFGSRHEGQSTMPSSVVG